MTPELNDLLDDIRLTLGEELKKLGPETQEIGQHSHLSSEAGVGNAENIQDANDAVDKFLADLASQLMVSKGMSEDEAFDFVFDYLDTVEDEHISEIPDDDADPEELLMWLGKATTYGLQAKVLKAAQGK